MGKVWPVQDAKARFSELLATSLVEGPQIVSKRGVETAVLVPIEQWRRLKQRTKPDLKQLLLAPEARTDLLTVTRGILVDRRNTMDSQHAPIHPTQSFEEVD